LPGVPGGNVTVNCPETGQPLEVLLSAMRLPETFACVPARRGGPVYVPVTSPRQPGTVHWMASVMTSVFDPDTQVPLASTMANPGFDVVSMSVTFDTVTGMDMAFEFGVFFVELHHCGL
jgi:hypothetical protein